MRLSEIKARFGPQGIAEVTEAYGRTGAITDDTQVTLFTAEGFLRAYVQAQLKGPCSVPSAICHADLRWLLTQGITPTSGKLDIGKDGWLWNVKTLHSRRAPGNTCISSLRGLAHFTADRADNNSKGAGAIMRVAPVACAVQSGDELAAGEVFTLGNQASWITYGHPSGYLSANHDGDSDTTGLLVGQLLGAIHGEAAIPAHWLRDLEAVEAVRQASGDLCDHSEWNLEDLAQADRVSVRYPGW